MWKERTADKYTLMDGWWRRSAKLVQKGIAGRQGRPILTERYVLVAKSKNWRWVRGINLSSGRGQTICQEESAFFSQTTGSWACSDGGTGVALRAACGARQRKRWKSKRGKESAMDLRLPAVWQEVKTKDWRVAVSDGWRRRTIMRTSARHWPQPI